VSFERQFLVTAPVACWLLVVPAAAQTTDPLASPAGELAAKVVVTLVVGALLFVFAPNYTTRPGRADPVEPRRVAGDRAARDRSHARSRLLARDYDRRTGGRRSGAVRVDRCPRRRFRAGLGEFRNRTRRDRQPLGRVARGNARSLDAVAGPDRRPVVDIAVLVGGFGAIVTDMRA
jgi:hypothetical protein